MKNEEIKYIDYQIYILLITIVTTIVAIIITYNQKLGLQKKQKLFDPETSLKITKYNRIIILITGILFLYINYRLYKLSEEEGEDLKSYKLQILASILVVISELIALYVITLSSTETISDVENPNI